MSDRHLITLSTGVAVAAFMPIDAGAWSVLARVFLVVLCVGAWWRRSPLALGLALATFVSLHAGAAWAAAATWEPIDDRRVVTLMTDPEPVDGGVRVRLDVDGRLHDARAWGGAAGHLRNRLMGERVTVDVRTRPLQDPPAWIVAQGLVGRATVTGAHGFDEGAPHTRLANSLRRTIESGASSMTRDERALFTGLVYGDDRSQSPLTTDDFAAAGLSHLVAVSGQNVAFVLAIGGPLLRRLGPWARWCAVGLLLLVFATMTRFEPSVLRASVMAAVAATGALAGSAVPAVRVLVLAATTVVVWSPLIVHSVAFQLSVAASAGILFWSARVARAIPGPRPLAEAVAVTASAQLAVSPLLLWRFGEVPVAALPANLLAGPASGPVMMWGMTAGWVAGLVPDGVAVVLHVPTRLGVRWIAGVASWSAGLPLGTLGWVHVVGVGGSGWWLLRQTSMVRRGAAVGVVVALLAAPWFATFGAEPESGVFDSGTVVLHGERGAVVVAAGRPDDVLADLRRARVGEIDLLVFERSSFANAALAGWIERRHEVGAIWAPVASMGRGEVVPAEGDRWPIGDVELVATMTDDRLAVSGAPG